MEHKLFDSELKVMDTLWKAGGDLSASQIAKILQDEIGWNRNTTYTVIKKCIAKGAIKRTDPKFQCHALITRKQVQEYETGELIDKMFDGSKQKFFAAFISDGGLTEEELRQLREMVSGLESRHIRK